MVERLKASATAGNGPAGVGSMGMGSQLYNEVFRLITEWHGSDAGRQTAGLPQLVEKLVRLQEIDGQAIVTVSASADPQAA